MVQLSGIGPVEYMLIFATFQDKELTSPDELTQLDIELPLRIGFVLDWLIKPKLEASQSQIDPMLYNRARKMLINNAAQKYSEQFCPLDTWFHRQGRSIQEMPDGHIPNLSVDYNKKRYHWHIEFFLIYSALNNIF